MQLLPNSQQIPSHQAADRKKLLVWFGLGLVTLVGLVVLINAVSNRKTPNTLKPNEYYDKNSGETVSSPVGKAPDTYGTVAGQPVYLGISKLLDYGVTLDQLNATKLAFYAYSRSVGSSVREVSINVSSVSAKPFNADAATQTLSFKTQFNRGDTYDTQLDYSGLHDVRLYIRNGSGAVVFDSGTVNWDTSPGE